MKMALRALVFLLFPSIALAQTFAIGAAPVPYPNFVLLTASSGTWTPPAGVTQVMLEGCGGGSGGGGVANATAAGAGGNNGETIQALYQVTPGTPVSYTTGSGGNGGAAGNNNGAAGGPSTFGTITLFGGLAALGSASGNVGVTTSAVANNRHFFVPSAAVMILNSGEVPGVASTTGLGGIGFDGRFLGLAWGTPGAGGVNAAGGNASGYCVGGGGASSTSSGAFAGGNGAPGAWVIRY